VAGGRPQAPRGTFDVLPEDGRRRLALFNLCQAMLAHSAGFEYVETPIFEDTDLFARSVGSATDIVQKEMFTFEDKAGRSLTLRPEETASVCRAYVEHGMQKRPQPVRLWYWGPFFRHEAPQAGRYRQFAQVGIETIGSDEPAVDAEAIVLLAELLERARCREVRLRLSSLGSLGMRRDYARELAGYLRARASELAPTVRERIESNPLRAFDSQDPGTRAVMSEAPKLLDRLEGEDADHFAAVRRLLDEVGVVYEVDPTLVRGLDYYTRTVFEFESGVLGAQAGVGGGGRYDDLVELLGGPATPAVGWAAGIERILLAADPETTGHWGDAAPPRVYVAAAEASAAKRGFALVHELRREGVVAQLEQAGRSLKGQLRHADRLGARFAVILDGDAGMELKDMRTGEQRRIASAAEIVRAADPQVSGP
jgi:histidyl-tRNA synthetase